MDDEYNPEEPTYADQEDEDLLASQNDDGSYHDPDHFKAPAKRQIAPIQIDVEDLQVQDDEDQPGQQPGLMLDATEGSLAASCVMGSQGIKLSKIDSVIETGGMRKISTGELIQGNLIESDLEYGQTLGSGASGYVY